MGNVDMSAAAIDFNNVFVNRQSCSASNTGRSIY